MTIAPLHRVRSSCILRGLVVFTVWGGGVLISHSAFAENPKSKSAEKSQTLIRSALLPGIADGQALRAKVIEACGIIANLAQDTQSMRSRHASVGSGLLRIHAGLSSKPAAADAYGGGMSSRLEFIERSLAKSLDGLGKLSSSGNDLRQSAAAGQKQLMEAVSKTKQAKVQAAWTRMESDKIIQASVKRLLANGGKAAAEDMIKYGQRVRSSLSKVESILDQGLKSKNLGGRSLPGIAAALSIGNKKDALLAGAGKAAEKLRAGAGLGAGLQYKQRIQAALAAAPAAASSAVSCPALDNAIKTKVAALRAKNSAAINASWLKEALSQPITNLQELNQALPGLLTGIEAANKEFQQYDANWKSCVKSDKTGKTACAAGWKPLRDNAKKDLDLLRTIQAGLTTIQNEVRADYDKTCGGEQKKMCPGGKTPQNAKGLCPCGKQTYDPGKDWCSAAGLVRRSCPKNNLACAESSMFPKTLSAAQKTRVQQSLDALSKTDTGKALIKTLGLKTVSLQGLSNAGVEVRVSTWNRTDVWASAEPAKNPAVNGHVLLLNPNVLDTKTNPDGSAAVLVHELSHAVDQRRVIKLPDGQLKPVSGRTELTELDSQLNEIYFGEEIKKKQGKFCDDQTSLCQDERLQLRIWEDKLTENPMKKGEFKSPGIVGIFNNALDREKKNISKGTDQLLYRIDQSPRYHSSPAIGTEHDVMVQFNQAIIDMDKEFRHANNFELLPYETPKGRQQPQNKP
ncbi:MAG: hypothetical protein HY922_08230 [Elusimicrobia bacterium]|nr:hypothetical protein [Elusimicrobiota bacterium]